MEALREADSRDWVFQAEERRRGREVAVGCEGRVAAGVGRVNEAVETVVASGTDDEMPLRGRRAPAHLPCRDRQGVEGTSCEPVPATVPGEFVVYLRTDDVPDALEAGMTELLLTWIEWVEVEVRGIDHFVEELRRLRGAVMVAAVV